MEHIGYLGWFSKRGFVTTFCYAVVFFIVSFKKKERNIRQPSVKVCPQETEGDLMIILNHLAASFTFNFARLFSSVILYVQLCYDDLFPSGYFANLVKGETIEFCLCDQYE